MGRFGTVGTIDPRVAQRDKPKQANNIRNEGISLKRQSEKGVKQRRAWREKEEQAEESGRNVPDKSIEHAAKRVFPVARRAV